MQRKWKLSWPNWRHCTGTYTQDWVNTTKNLRKVVLTKVQTVHLQNSSQKHYSLSQCLPWHVHWSVWEGFLRQKAAKNSRLLECELCEHFQCSKGSEHLDAKNQGGQEHHRRAMKPNLFFGLQIKCKPELEAISFPYSYIFSAQWRTNTRSFLLPQLQQYTCTFINDNYDNYNTNNLRAGAWQV